ncbi:hypothetical protein CCACVL1_09530, partial [Corchorus capsularis]
AVFIRGLLSVAKAQVGQHVANPCSSQLPAQAAACGVPSARQFQRLANMPTLRKANCHHRW